MILDFFCKLENLDIRVIYATIVSKHTNINLLRKHIIDHYKTKDIKFNLTQMDLESQERKFNYRISIDNDDNLYPSEEKVYELYNMYKELMEEIPITSNLYPYTDVIYHSIIVKLDSQSFMFVYPPNYCGIFNDMVTIFPGKIGSCHMTPFQYGLNPTKEQYDYLFNNDKYFNCDFFLVCRGLCVNRNLQAPKAMDSYCLWAKLSFELAIERLYILNDSDDENFKRYLDNISISIDDLI